MTSLRNVMERAGAAIAAAFFLAVLFSLFQAPQVPALVGFALCALVIVAALTPDRALCALAVAVPIASWLGRQWNPSVTWAETLVVAFCAGYTARAALRRAGPSPSAGDALAPPLVLVTAIVIASLAVQLLIDAWRFGEASTMRELVALFTTAYFVTAVSADPVDAAMRLIESLVLLRAAASTARAMPGLAPRVIAWAVTGAALAAALNLVRLWEGAVRMEAPALAFVRYFMTERLNVHYADVNAAGSYFVMMLIVALGVSLAANGRRWWSAAALVGSSVWLTNSRMAMMVGVLALLLPAGALAMRIRRRHLRGTSLAAAAAVLALVAGAAAYALPERGNQKSALAATQVRLELARTSLHMTASKPVFGVGVGRYYSRSGEFSSAELLRLFPPAIHENAHNNFFQLLAELGVAGFAAIAWMLGVAAWLSVRLLAADRRDPVRWGLVTGLLAFVLSWLGGHPLLIDEPAFTFWLLAGAACGWGAAVAPIVRSRRLPAISAAVVLFVAASVPVRIAQQRADFDLEHRGIGLSAWQSAVDGVRYRFADATSSIFVPSSAQLLVIPVRSVGGGNVRVEIRMDGRPADAVNVSDDRWHYLRLQLSPDRDAPRFRRLELRTAPGSGGGPVLMVGKVEPR